MVVESRERFRLFVFNLIELVQAPDFDGCIVTAADKGVARFRHEYNLIDPVRMTV